MATKAQLWTYLAHTAKRYAQLKAWGRTASPNFIGLLEAQQTLNYGQEFGALADHLTGQRRGYERLMLEIAEEARLCFNEIGIKYGVSPGPIEQTWPRVWEGMTGSETVRNRGWTRDAGGPVFSFTGTGSGVLYRNVYDKAGQIRENGRAQTTRAEVIASKNAGGSTSGNELLVLKGNPTGEPDTGPLKPGTIAPSPDTDLGLAFLQAEDGLLSNPSFNTGTGSGAAVNLPGWSVDAGTMGTNIIWENAAAAANTDGAPMRNAPGQTTGRCVSFTGAAARLQQVFSYSDIGAKINRSRPLLLVAPFRKETGTPFQGTAFLRLGSKTTTLAHGAMTAGWRNDELYIPFSSGDSFLDNFEEDDVRVQAGISAWTQGKLYMGNIGLYQMEGPYIDGAFYSPVAGLTDMLVDDYTVITDTVADTGAIQTMLSDLLGIYVPHASGSETYADV